MEANDNGQQQPLIGPEALAELRKKLEENDGERWCGRCRYFVVDEDRPREGECRRFPPTPVALPVIEDGKPKFVAISCTPSVSRNETCGEFSARQA